MACIIKPECNFLHGYFRCLLPIETMDVKVEIKMMRGIYTLRRDWTTQVHILQPLDTPVPKKGREEERQSTIKEEVQGESDCTAYACQPSFAHELYAHQPNIAHEPYLAHWPHSNSGYHYGNINPNASNKTSNFYHHIHTCDCM